MTNALLRTLGGKQIQVRIQLSDTTSGDPSQLGLVATPTQLVALAPVVVRRNPSKTGDTKSHQLMLSASTLANAQQITTTSDARNFFLSALSITVECVDMRVISFEADEFSGAPYLYRVVVEE
jgi:hypothetical protein